MTGQGRTEAVQFGVSIPQATPPGKRIGTVSISRDGIPLGHLKYRYAFVSYASQDRDEVLQRVQMLSITGLRYVEPRERVGVGAKGGRLRARVSGRRRPLSPGDPTGDHRRPPVIAPWEDLAHLHFNDRVLYFMNR